MTTSHEEAWEVVQQPDGLWRWRWLSADGREPLVSAEAYFSSEEAEHSARSAYPGLPGRVQPGLEPPPLEKVKRAGTGTLANLVLLALVVARRRRPPREP